MDLKAELEKFSKSNLRPTVTTITRPDGTKWLEEGLVHQDDGYTISRLSEASCPGYVVDDKPDLQVGCIVNGLLLGSVDVISDESLLKQHKITHILNVAEHTQGLFPVSPDIAEISQKYVCKHVSILDLPEVQITNYFDECFAFIDDALQTNGRVLVHCMAGVSRSASIVIAYLMKNRNMDFKTAFAHVKSKRPSVHPNHGFMRQLKEYEISLQTARAS